MNADQPDGKVTKATGKWLEGVSSILRGNFDEGVDLGLEAAVEMERVSFERMRLICLTSLAVNLPRSDPRRAEIATSARQSAEENGASGLAEWIERVTAVGGS